MHFSLEVVQGGGGSTGGCAALCDLDSLQVKLLGVKVFFVVLGVVLMTVPCFFKLLGSPRYCSANRCGS
jgi:hypothetical protein